ncbi:hypothetical protein [Rhodococcus sp. IEGM 1408]|nr:hypothetical protein [Rhodococcus sp. IEGM 1408]MDV8001595.1 hypothetical protein [Rhodococcus sp. IEGM 1408]
MGSSELSIFSKLVDVVGGLFGDVKSGVTGLGYFLGEDFGKALAAGFMK